MLDSCLTVEFFSEREREREFARIIHARLKENSRARKRTAGYDLTVARQSCRAVHVTIKISPTSRKPLRESLVREIRPRL